MCNGTFNSASRVYQCCDDQNYCNRYLNPLLPGEVDAVLSSSATVSSSSTVELGECVCGWVGGGVWGVGGCVCLDVHVCCESFSSSLLSSLLQIVVYPPFSCSSFSTNFFTVSTSTISL